MSLIHSFAFIQVRVTVYQHILKIRMFKICKYIYVYIYVAVQGLLRKARNIKRDMSRKRGYQPKKNLYLYVVAAIMTKFQGYQFNTPHPPIYVGFCSPHSYSNMLLT